MMTKQQLEQYICEADEYLLKNGIFSSIEKNAFVTQKKVMDAFEEFRVSEASFNGTSGYGYDDLGRDTLDKIYARVFDSQSAFVRHNIVSGTHALTIALFGLLRPGDTMFSISGKPYDTLEEVIGIRGKKGNGSLADFGVKYKQCEFKDGFFDFDEIEKNLRQDNSIKVVFIQRSKGYGIRPTLSSEQIGQAVEKVKTINSNIYVVVDNCYGEFCCVHEPTYYGADLIVGSLIKNPGGGMAESGGYIAGNAKAVELCSYRLTSPGVGTEVGATLGQNKNMIKGIFYAPHTVAQALKTAVFAAKLFEIMGFKVYPLANEPRYDIIQTVSLETQDNLLKFCRGIQAGAPVNSYVTPEPWDMPGYNVPVIMAAGAFTQGASIELSADAPCVYPFTAYLQGALTYESGKLGIIKAAEMFLDS